MSTSCSGKVVRNGVEWECLGCGLTSTAWNTQHTPFLSRAALFLVCLGDLVREVEQEETVVAAQAA